jgi:hypothetical protein
MNLEIERLGIMRKSAALGISIIIISLIALFYANTSLTDPKGVATTAVIIEKKIRSARAKPPHMTSTITVSYEVEGKTYMRILDKGLPFNTSEGKVIKIYYNPDNPKEIWGAANPSNGVAKWFLIAGIVILMAGMGFNLHNRRT